MRSTSRTSSSGSTNLFRIKSIPFKILGRFPNSQQYYGNYSGVSFQESGVINRYGFNLMYPYIMTNPRWVKRH